MGSAALTQEELLRPKLITLQHSNRTDRAHRSHSALAAGTHLTQEQVDDVEHHVERELGSEERQKPLRGVHVCFEADVQEVVVQVRNVLLKQKAN